MDRTPPVLTPLQRFVGLPLLLAYVAFLGLGALVTEVRPTFLDAPSRWANSALEVLGIRSGHVLMHSTIPTEWRFQSYCIHVRGEGDMPETVTLFPPDGICPNSGIRPRLPPVERALYRMLRNSWANYLRARNRQSVVAVAAGRRSREMLATIGAHFCRRPEMSEIPKAQIALLWYAWLTSYETGELKRLNYLNYRYRCSDGLLWKIAWGTDDEQVLGFWGQVPWTNPPWE